MWQFSNCIALFISPIDNACIKTLFCICVNWNKEDSSALIYKVYILIKKVSDKAMHFAN